MLDTHGTVVAKYGYDPYGNQIGHTGAQADNNTIGYTGAYTLKDGLALLGYRYYSSQLGRFFQQDPTRKENNLYNYAGDDPINHTDLSGGDYLTCVGKAAVNGAISGAIVGGIGGSFVGAIGTVPGILIGGGGNAFGQTVAAAVTCSW